VPACPDVSVRHCNIGILLNDGHGSLGDPSIYAPGTDALSIAAADLNGDGTPDIAVTDPDDVIVLLNASH
jgi:hypothetical protein